jgi:hypothetical protein
MSGAGENGGLQPAPVRPQAARFVNVVLGKYRFFILASRLHETSWISLRMRRAASLSLPWTKVLNSLTCSKLAMQLIYFRKYG